MFKIGLTDRYFWPVEIEVPADGGKREKHRFELAFHRFDQTTCETIAKRFELYLSAYGTALIAEATLGNEALGADRAELRRLIDQLTGVLAKLDGDDDQAEEPLKPITPERLCHLVTVDWKGVCDEEGSPLPFSLSNFEQLLQITGVRGRIVTAWFESGKTGAEKNSKRPPASGRSVT